MSEITLRPVTAATVRMICALEVREDQRGFVAPNSVSIAQAHFEPTASFSAIYGGETPVGFLMWRPTVDTKTAYLWRFMIDHRHQGKGYARSALMLLFQELRARGLKLLKTSVVLGAASPLGFYRSMGFQETGKILPNSETELLLDLEWSQGFALQS
ncbi:GNAT family N-acetyltransferase [Bosea lathyri]|uniref:Diamine N-acetyltransferase n=1 Tax=Bosea lathyri TaxID=1036778 RepID=A0A1H5T703_9HYPH|nr:GNAT family N-acetyltransferase [Bosea lathyri]SEF58569.1 diamine N-acetyltransferase [Bosea lathyri]